MPLLKRKPASNPPKAPKPPKETRLELDLRNGRVVLTRTPVAVPATPLAPTQPTTSTSNPPVLLPPVPTTDRALPPPPYGETEQPAEGEVGIVAANEAQDWLSLGYKLLPAMQAVGTGLVAVAGVVGVWMEMEKERRKAGGGK